MPNPARPETTLDAIVEFVKASLVPGSFPFLLISASLGVVGLFFEGRGRRASRLWLAAVVLGYWMLSLPACASTIQAGLDRGYMPLTADQAGELGIQTVVVLGGGIEAYRGDGRVLSSLSEPTALRVLEGARLYGLLGDPLVIVSGGGGSPSHNGGIPESRAMRQALISIGVPAERILEESSSTDTRQEALNIRMEFSDHVAGPFALVTSPTHMRRALAAFQGVGLEPIPSVAGEGSESSISGLRLVLPSFDSLGASASAIREYMALGYYTLRGWTTIPGS